MGVTQEIDLLMGEPADKQASAKDKFDRGLIEFSSQLGGGNTASPQKHKSILEKLDRDLDAQSGNAQGKKKEKQERYLTVQGLLNHPYFIQINEADIAVIIDEFEKFTQSY